MKNSKYILLSVLLIVIYSCNKEDETVPTSSCDTNQGTFEVEILGNTYSMIDNPGTQFTIIYNAYGFQESAFIINAEDQNANELYVELALPGTFNTGTTNYSDLLFDIDVDTFNIYVSEASFTVSESDLNTQDGIYRPVVSTFTGTAHSYPWISGQPPADTINISGSFCLNGLMMP